MKLSHFFKVLYITILSFVFCAFKTFAVENIDERVKNLTLELRCMTCLLYTSDAADEEDSVDLGGRRIIKKKSGCSILQGLHQEAKKLIKVFLFFISFVLIISFELYKELLSKIGTSLFKSALGGLLGSLPLNK